MLRLCYPKPVTTFFCGYSCCHCPVAATLVSVAAASLFSLLLSSPSLASCYPCHCPPAASGTDWHLSIPHHGAELFTTPGSEPSDAFTPSGDTSWAQPSPELGGFAGEGSSMVTLRPVGAALPPSETGRKESCIFKSQHLRAWRLSSFIVSEDESSLEMILSKHRRWLWRLLPHRVPAQIHTISRAVLCWTIHWFQCQALKVALQCSASSSVFLTKLVRFK